MPTKIQLKRGLNANLNAATLAAGEPAFVTDTGKLYVGDGTNKVLINPIDKPTGIDTTTAYTKVTVNQFGQVTAQSSLAVADVPNIPTTKVTGLGTAATKDIGTTTGTIPVLDANGDIPLAQIPNIPSNQVTGLGTAATVNTGTGIGNVPVLDATSKLPTSVIPNLTPGQITGLGTAATLDTGVGAGNVPVLDSNGKLLASTMPSIAVTDTFVVPTEAAMLALTCEVGDIAVRTDVKQTYILKTAPAAVLANWVMLQTPTDAVTSVNGQTGVVSLVSSNIPMTGYAKAASYVAVAPADNTSVAIGKLEKNFDSFAPLASPALSGTPTAPTPVTTDNTTKIATTQYVKANLTTYAPLASPSFTGTPTSTTAAQGDNSTKIATTAYVDTALLAIDGGAF